MRKIHLAAAAVVAGGLLTVAGPAFAGGTHGGEHTSPPVKTGSQPPPDHSKTWEHPSPVKSTTTPKVKPTTPCPDKSTSSAPATTKSTTVAPTTVVSTPASTVPVPAKQPVGPAGLPLSTKNPESTVPTSELASTGPSKIEGSLIAALGMFCTGGPLLFWARRLRLSRTH